MASTRQHTCKFMEIDQYHFFYRMIIQKPPLTSFYPNTSCNSPGFSGNQIIKLSVEDILEMEIYQNIPSPNLKLASAMTT